MLSIGSSLFAKRSLEISRLGSSGLTLGTLDSLSLGSGISVSLDSRPVTVSRLWQGAFCNFISGFTYRVDIYCLSTSEKSKVKALGNLSATLDVRVLETKVSRRVFQGKFSKIRDKLVQKSGDRIMSQIRFNPWNILGVVV